MNINRFSLNKFIFNTFNKKIRLLEPKLNKAQLNFIIISIDNDFIFDGHKKYLIKEYKLIKNNIYIVKNLKSNMAINLKGILITDVFSYVSLDNIERNIIDDYSYLKNIFDTNAKISHFNFTEKSLQKQYSRYFKFKQNRKLRFKSLLDNNFFFGVETGYSQVFKLLEDRKESKIYLLDVNSMHPYSMTLKNYANPETLNYYNNISINNILNNKISNGIFNCEFSIKKELTNKEREFAKYIYLSFRIDNVSYFDDIRRYKKITKLLHSNEIVFYSKYFNITILDGIYSNDTIYHPLKNISDEYYKKRVETKSIEEKNILKFLLVMMHSVSNSYHSEYKYLSYEGIRNFLKQKFQFHLTPDTIISDKYFNMMEKDNCFKLNCYKIDDNNIYSLYSQLLANSRIHLLSIYEKIFFKNSRFELCYANIDSLHISIPSDKENDFLSVINPIVSNKLGDLKIEAIGNRGIWFEAGRYWIYKDTKLIDYKNTIFKSPDATFDTMKKDIIYLDNKNIEITHFYLFNTLSHKKKIKYISKRELIYDYNYDYLENKLNNINYYYKIFFTYIKK